jgi:hypothetical protein
LESEYTPLEAGLENLSELLPTTNARDLVMLGAPELTSADIKEEMSKMMEEQETRIAMMLKSLLETSAP